MFLSRYFVLFVFALSACTCGDREVYVKDPVVQCHTNEDCNQSVCVLGQCIPGECVKDADCLPLAPTCMTSTVSLLRPLGECSDEYLCVYTSIEEECEYGCNFDTGACVTDPCEGVTCQEPPNPCFGSQGWCENGACLYPPRNDLMCDDGNACTRDDVCSEGVCLGELQECAFAPPDDCVGDMVLRSFIPGTGVCDSATGLCDYQYEDLTCEVGCGMVAPTANDAGPELPSTPSTLSSDGGLGDAGPHSEPTAEPVLGPTAQCLPDLCVDVDCDDGNPCTTDTCDSRTGICSHEGLNNQSLCLTGEDQCGEGRCIQGQCVSFDGRSCTRPGRCTEGTCVSGECQAVGGGVCQAEVDRDLCDDMEVPGHCSATGECVPDIPPPTQCEGVQCNGICLQCTIAGVIPITFCWEF
ncbi:MAG: hypothetical protein CMH56_01345 [Myxococcales bacterium]|nr:hypothetical protein [Myxococcales bacterium]